ncbi:MAG: radical SAM protein [archaeon]
MKIKLLFSPRFHCDPNDYRPINPPFFPPLGISVLKTYMEERGYDVDLDDIDIKTAHANMKGQKIDLKIFLDERRVERYLGPNEDPEFDELARKIVRLTDLKGYDVAGLSLMPTDNPSSAGVAGAIGKVIKEDFGAMVIIGGSVEERVERKLLASGYVDFRILGHPTTSIGEVNLLRFCREYERGTDLKTVIGTTYVKDGRYVCNSKEYPKEDETLITKPTFDGLPMELYTKTLTRGVDGADKSHPVLVLPYYFIRGCPNRCAFCSIPMSKYWKPKDPETAALEIKELARKFRTRYFYFHNATINPTYEYATDFAEAMIRHDVDVLWSDCANINPMDEKLIAQLRQAGAARFVFGFESANPHILSYIRKNFTLDDAERVLKLCHKHDVWPELDMICGFPYETEFSAECTKKFITKNKKYIGACSLNMFWLEGEFRKYPGRYGINFNQDSSNTHTNWSVNSFNETYGLKWDEKIEQTKRSFAELEKFIYSNFERAPDIHNLFFNMWLKGR